MKPEPRDIVVLSDDDSDDQDARKSEEEVKVGPVAMCVSYDGNRSGFSLGSGVA